MVNLFLRTRRQSTVTRGISRTAYAAWIWSSVVDKQAAFAASHKAEQVGVTYSCHAVPLQSALSFSTQSHTSLHNKNSFRLLIIDRRKLTRMWANAQRDGRPAEYRWRPLFNAAKFG